MKVLSASHVGESQEVAQRCWERPSQLVVRKRTVVSWEREAQLHEHEIGRTNGCGGKLIGNQNDRG